MGRDNGPKPEQAEQGWQVATYADEALLEALDRHYTTYLGTYTVFHELVSDLVHVDVCHVAPASQRPFHTLITMGMSALPMTVPPEVEHLQRAELMLCLPPQWQVSDQAFRNDKYYWPLRELKALARFPHAYNTWLGPFHTVANAEPPQPYWQGVGFTGAILVPPITVPEEFQTLKLDSGDIVNFYGVIPLYQEELKYKLKHDGFKLLERLVKLGVTEILDPVRKNTCKRSWPFG